MDYTNTTTFRQHSPMMAADSILAHHPHFVRYRHSCEHCRKRKIKCSGTRPICDHCLRRSIPCIYKPLARTRHTPTSSATPMGSIPQDPARQARALPISIPTNSTASGYFMPPRYASAPSPIPTFMLHPMFDSGSDSNKLPNAIPQHLYEPNMLSAMSPLTTPQAASFGGSDMAGSFNSVHSDFSELTSPNGIMPGIIQGGSGNMDDTMGVGGLSNCSMYDAQTSGQPESQQNMSLNIPQTAPAGSIGFGYTGFSLPTHSNLSFSMPADNFGSYFRDSGGSLAAFPPSSSSSTGQNNFLQDPLMSAAAVAAASAATKMVLDERLEHPPHRRKRTLTNDSTDSLSNMPLLERASLETDNSIGQMIGCNNDERVYADLISSFSICQNNAAADLGGYAFLDNGFSLSSSMNIHQDVAGNNGPPHGLAGVDDGGIAPELTIYQQAGASTKKSNGCGYNQEKNVTTNI